MSELLQTPPLTSLTLNSVEFMVQEVADLIGGTDDLDIRTKAMRMLDRAADRMNAAGVYLFRRKEYSGFAAFTTGQSTLTLPSDFAWATDPAVAYNVQGNSVQNMEWKTWEIYRWLLQNTSQNNTGVPAYLTILNELDGIAYLYPYIDPAQCSSIKMTYFARIVRISEVSDGNVYLSPEGRECLITGGQAMMVRQRFLTKPAIWEPMMKDFDNLITLAKQAAYRNQQAEHISARPDESGNLSVNTFTPGPRATVYLGF